MDGWQLDFWEFLKLWDFDEIIFNFLINLKIVCFLTKLSDIQMQ